MITPMRRLAWLGVSLLSAVLLAGCWDSRDISDRSAAIAMGFDFQEGTGWRVALNAATLSQSGAGSSYKGVLHTGDGQTLTEAIEDLRTHLARRLYVGSVKIYVVGPGVLKDRLPEVVQFLLNKKEVDSTGFLVGSLDPTDKLLSEQEGAVGLTAVRLLKEFEGYHESRDGHIAQTIWNATREIDTPGASVFLPVFKIIPSKTGAQAFGNALIGPDGKLKIIVDREESVTLRWLMGITGRNVLVLPDGQDLVTTSVHTQKNFLGSARQLAVRIRLTAAGYLLEKETIDSSMRGQLAQEAAETATRRSLALIAKLQRAGADVPEWLQSAEQAGYRDYDFAKATIKVWTLVDVAPTVKPTM